MSSATEELLARLAGKSAEPGGDPYASVAATKPRHEDASGEADRKLNNMLKRINSLAGAAPAEEPINTGSAIEAAAAQSTAGFVPIEPNSIAEASLNDSGVQSLALKYLLARSAATGRDIAEQVKLPFVLVDNLLRQLKLEQMVVYKSGAPMNDYLYQLTDMGSERARRLTDHSTYFGSAPVSLDAYIASVKAQSMEKQHPTESDLQRAFSDLLISKKMFRRLGPAINSGRGLFLFGFPGNGKTSIAERVTRAFGQHIWIPRALGVDGEIIRLFDPMNHEEVPIASGDGLLNQTKIDARWVRIKRPTIIVGGELTMDNLEVTFNPTTGISEAPLQMKSNCGTLVIDDFGRQKMRTDELLNRWIVPLEKRFDYLNLANGKKIQVPFDQLIIFSTNLEPKDLVDDAFLRRIPYKIEVLNPTEEEYRQLFKIMCPIMGFEHNESAITYLIEKYYLKTGRPFRCCQPRDLLLQVRNYCLYMSQPLELNNDYFDFATENYFAVM